MGAGRPRCEGLRAGIEMESACDQVTSDQGLRCEGCKYAALGATSCLLTVAGSRHASSHNGHVPDQNCMAGARLLVHRKVYDRVMAGIESFAKRLTIGPAISPDTDLGPLI